MIPTIETKRFLLRPFAETDREGLFALDSDPEVVRYLGNKPMQSIEQADSLIRYILQQYADFNIGRWVIEDKQTGEFIGWAGLKFVTELTNNQLDFYDIGYRLLQKHWGKGIAPECALASVIYGFEKMKLEAIHAGAHQENAASNHILQKLGFRNIEPFMYDNEPQYWYTLTAVDWMKRK